MTVITKQKESKAKVSLVAVGSKHEYKEYKENNKAYEVFNPEKNEYKIVLTKEFVADELYRALIKFLSAQKEAVRIDLDSVLSLLNETDHESALAVVVRASEYASVVPWTLKKEDLKKHEKPLQNEVFVTDSKLADKANELKVVAEAQTFARKLQDMPSNLMTPGAFEREIKALFKGVKNVKVNVLQRKDLEAKGFGCHVGVGQAAEKDDDQPRLVVVEYLNNPEDKDNKTAFVGKGVCFDTGGNNIKTGGHMRWMKFDMSGAAISASTIYALAKNNVKVNAYAVCPLVLNLCDSNALRPDDVVVSYSGKSVEIDNTDAEGRLILSDSLTYAAKDLKASRLLSIATLTGAVIYALGDTYTATWSTNEELWNHVSKSANLSGELVWRMPFHHDYLEMLNSKVADIANSVSNPRAGSSRAAEFLRQFTLDTPYVHFDVAATADKGNTGTGCILPTFYNFVQSVQCNGKCSKKAK